MPELPDVERNRALVQTHVVGTSIRSIEAADPTVLRNASIAQADAMLRGRCVISASRRGKWLIVATDGPCMLFHFGMTGKLRWASHSDPAQPYDRLSVVTATGELRYNDLRKLQGIWLAPDLAGASEVVGPQGPDASAVTKRQFLQLGARRSAIKSVLMDQTAIAGLGNMLSDEVLWRARIHPARPATSLSVEELAHLHRVMRSTLRSAVAAGAIPRTRSWLSSQRASDPPVCPRCHHHLDWLRINGRSSLWCPAEQLRA